MTTDPTQSDPQTHPAASEEQAPEIVPGENDGPSGSPPSGPDVVEADDDETDLDIVESPPADPQ